MVILVQAAWSSLVLVGAYIALRRTSIDGVGIAVLGVALVLAAVLVATVFRPVLWRRPAG
jgi:hypothetical protein